jgi:hypothetical protein
MFNFYLVHIKNLTYKSEVLLQNVFGINMRGEDMGEESMSGRTGVSRGDVVMM